VPASVSAGTARALDVPAQVCVSEVPDPVHAEPLIWKPDAQLYDAPPLPQVAHVCESDDDVPSQIEPVL
jgi:hypothetical protein